MWQAILLPAGSEICCLVPVGFPLLGAMSGGAVAKAALLAARRRRALSKKATKVADMELHTTSQLFLMCRKKG